MRIAVGSDMKTHLTGVVVAELRKMGHEVSAFGALAEGEVQWPRVAIEVGEAVAHGRFDQGVLFCWTGTGICMAANKVKGIRAALCHDAETARGARQWNDANILAMSLRSTAEPIAQEILEAWFSASPSSDAEDLSCLAYLAEAEKKLRADG